MRKQSWRVLVLASASRRGSWVRTGIGLLSGTTTGKGVVTLADQAVFAGAMVLTSIIIGRVCSAEQFGLYMLGYTITVFALPLQSALVTTPYMIFSPRLAGSALTQYGGSTLVHLLALSGAIGLALAVAAAVVSHGLAPTGLAPILWVLVLVMPPVLLRDYARRISFARLRMKAALLLDSCIFIIQIAALLALAHWGLLSANRALLVVGGACGVASLGWLVMVRRTFAPCIGLVVSDLRRNWPLGKWVCANSIISYAGALLYPWFLGMYCGTAATAVFSACLGAASLTNPLTNGVANLLGPKTSLAYALEGTAGVRTIVFKASLLLGLPVVLFCLAVAIYGNYFVVLLYGGKYAAHGVIVLILALGVLSATVRRAIRLRPAGHRTRQREFCCYPDLLLHDGDPWIVALDIFRALGRGLWASYWQQRRRRGLGTCMSGFVEIYRRTVLSMDDSHAATWPLVPRPISGWFAFLFLAELSSFPSRGSTVDGRICCTRPMRRPTRGQPLTGIPRDA